MPRSVILKKVILEKKNKVNIPVEYKDVFHFIYAKRDNFRVVVNADQIKHKLFLFLGLGLAGIWITSFLPFQRLFAEKGPWWNCQLYMRENHY